MKKLRPVDVDLSEPPAITVAWNTLRPAGS